MVGPKCSQGLGVTTGYSFSVRKEDIAADADTDTGGRDCHRLAT